MGAMKKKVVKTLAFVFGIWILAVGTAGLVAPSVLVRIAQHSGTSDAFYVIAAVRVALGLTLISVEAV
jgi:cyanate permease